jgi:uncharacterized protein YjbJ (UPF0337 family)
VTAQRWPASERTAKLGVGLLRWPMGRLQQETVMSKEGIEGATQKGVGAAKESLGKLTGNQRLQAEGVADKAVGSAKEVAGKAKDAIHKATK